MNTPAAICRLACLGVVALVCLLALAVLTIVPASGVLADTRLVTSNADSGPGTLRQAVIDANTGLCLAPCTITFDAPMTMT